MNFRCSLSFIAILCFADVGFGHRNGGRIPLERILKLYRRINSRFVEFKADNNKARVLQTLFEIADKASMLMENQVKIIRDNIRRDIEENIKGFVIELEAVDDILSWTEKFCPAAIEAKQIKNDFENVYQSYERVIELQARNISQEALGICRRTSTLPHEIFPCSRDLPSHIKRKYETLDIYVEEFRTYAEGAAKLNVIYDCDTIVRDVLSLHI